MNVGSGVLESFAPERISCCLPWLLLSFIHKFIAVDKYGKVGIAITTKT